MHDDILMPSRKEYGKSFEPEQSYQTIRKYYRCIGTELVSKVYDYYKLDSEVFPELKELHEELQFDYKHGVWFSEEEHLHVHFAFADEEVKLWSLRRRSVCCMDCSRTRLSSS